MPGRANVLSPLRGKGKQGHAFGAFHQAAEDVSGHAAEPAFGRAGEPERQAEHGRRGQQPGRAEGRRISTNTAVRAKRPEQAQAVSRFSAETAP